MNSLRVHKVYAGLLVAVFLFQLVTLLRISWSIGMWIDELYTLNAISLPWSDMFLERCRRGHPPLYFICAKATWLLTKGTTLPPEFRLRLISLVSWVTAVGAFAFMARRFLSPGAALLATTILVCSNISLLQAGNGRMYALALLLAVVHVGVTYQ
ncbi:MAG: hypothetical protein N2Z21_05025, partial [Candidatus Sumerlaeaceae bacterium]|nr:hypothetical protein [Candidatus Sumerlaeaceae bacterium]